MRAGRPEGAPHHKQYLYTIYLNRNDEVVAFEEPADRAAELAGIGLQTLYQYVSRQAAHPEGKYKYSIERTVIRGMDCEG